jgi:Mor transcription activator family protein
VRLRFDKLSQLFPKTLIPEVHRIFGQEVTEKLLTVFSGTTIHVPSVREQENAMRDIAIFETLHSSKGASESRRLGEALSAQYGISRRRVRHIYRTMRRLRKQNTKLVAEDLATSQHKGKAKSKRRRRR